MGGTPCTSQTSSSSLEPFRDLGRPRISPILGPSRVLRLAPLPSLPEQREGKGLQCGQAAPAPSRSPVLGNTAVSPHDCTRRSITRSPLLITVFYGSYPGSPGEVNWFSLPQPQGEGREAQRGKNEFGESQGQAVPSPSAFPTGIEAGIAPWESPFTCHSPPTNIFQLQCSFSPKLHREVEVKRLFLCASGELPMEKRDSSC